MYKVRWFSVEPSGTYPVTEDAANREEAVARAKQIAAELGFRAIVLVRIRKRWSVDFSTAAGY